MARASGLALVGWFFSLGNPSSSHVFRRLQGYRWWLGELEKNEGGIEKFAEGYKIFGWNRDNEKGWDDWDWMGAWCWIGYTRVQVLRLVCKHQEVVRNKTI